MGTASVARLATLFLFALVARGTGQGPVQVPQSLVAPGVSCTRAQLEAGAKPDTNDTQGIIPPVPKRPFARPRLALSPLAGPDTTLLRFVVDTTGEIDPCSVRVLRESSREWTESVVEAILQGRFVPARSQGRPIRYVITFQYRQE
ncbi:MAG TPA: hypothetical protein VIQ98_05420 [Gemmatimonadales bacterium]|jgi:Gram-negative bacterial tonB protein.